MATNLDQFDPWGPISSILYEINDSDFVLNAIGRTGVSVSWTPFDKATGYSHGTRIRSLRQDIEGAYRNLDQEARGQFVQIVVKAMLGHHGSEKVRASLLASLADIGWTLSESGLVVTKDALISEQFFPVNSEHDAYIAIRDVLGSAMNELVVVDAYVGSSLLQTLAAVAHCPLKVRVLTIKKHLAADFKLELDAFRKQLPDVTVELRTAAEFHDRFVVVDGVDFYHVGASIKDAGKRAFMASRVKDASNTVAINDAIEKAWASADSA